MEDRLGRVIGIARLSGRHPTLGRIHAAAFVREGEWPRHAWNRCRHDLITRGADPCRIRVDRLEDIPPER